MQVHGQVKVDGDWRRCVVSDSGDGMSIRLLGERLSYPLERGDVAWMIRDGALATSLGNLDQSTAWEWFLGEDAWRVARPPVEAWARAVRERDQRAALGAESRRTAARAAARHSGRARAVTRFDRVCHWAEKTSRFVEYRGGGLYHLSGVESRLYRLAELEDLMRRSA